jgi:hypothetical protein
MYEMGVVVYVVRYCQSRFKKINSANASNERNQPYERNIAEKTTPNNDSPEMASATASLVFDDDAGFADPVAAALPVGLLVADPEPLAEGDDETVGSPVYKAAEVKVWQLLLEGTRATYGIVVMAPRDSGGWV